VQPYIGDDIAVAASTCAQQSFIPVLGAARDHLWKNNIIMCIAL
jgi:hypothetical protein